MGDFGTWRGASSFGEAYGCSVSRGFMQSRAQKAVDSVKVASVKHHQH